MAEKRGKNDGRKDLAQHLRTLRSDFEEIIGKYALNVQAQIEETIRNVEQENADENRKVLKSKDIEKMVTGIRKMKIKPNKGRLKDIKRIQTLLDDIEFILSTYE